MSARADWPAWARYTASALAGCIVTVVTVTVAWADVRHAAETASRVSIENARVISEQPWRAEIKVAFEEHSSRPHPSALSRSEIEGVVRAIFSDISGTEGLYAREGRARLTAIEKAIDRIHDKLDRLLEGK